MKGDDWSVYRFQDSNSTTKSFMFFCFEVEVAKIYDLIS